MIGVLLWALVQAGPTPAAGTVASTPASPSTTASTRNRVEGTLRQSGGRALVVDAQVLAVPADADQKEGPVPAHAFLDPAAAPPAWIRDTTSTAEGTFAFDDLPSAKIRIIVIASGNERMEFIIDTGAPRRRPLTLFLEPDEASAYRTTVESARPPQAGQVTSRELTAEEIATAPGSQGDPLRALQNFPGVARSPGGLGLLVLRGASPNQSRVFLGGHALPRAFHALAISSVIPAAAIDRLEFIPGNFGARYGDATGGVIVIHPARLQREAVHGHARLDLLGVGALAGGKVGKGAWLVAAQRGWVDTVLRTVEAIDETQTFLLPRYYDYQAFLEYPLRGRSLLTARVLGSGDRVQSRTRNSFTREAGDRNVAFELGSQFHRADLDFKTRHQAWTFWLTPSFRFERNAARQPPAGSSSVRDDYVVSFRAEASRPLSRRTTLMVGADAEIDSFTAETRDDSGGAPNQIDGRPQSVIGESGLQTAIGVYTHVDFRVANWSIVPGLRVTGFTLGTAAEASVDPRLSARWDFADRWSWSMGVGLYSQALVPQRSVSGQFLDELTSGVAGIVILPASIRSIEPRAGFAPVADAISVAQALQGSTALSREFGKLWFAELGAFARVRDNADGILYDSVSGTEFVIDSTYSTAWGLEALVRRNLGRRLWGWVGYTLSSSRDRIIDQVFRDRTSQPTDFDQRHNLVLLASYQLPRRWRIGGRFRLVSGSPHTALVGAVWVPNSSNVLVAGGPTNGARFPIFHQLDLRVDKQWVLRRAAVGAYVDVQNVYNRVNPEAYIYDYDLRTRVNAIGLPIFPSLGLRVDY